VPVRERTGKRGKRYVADYYDSFRRRRWKTFRTKEAANRFWHEQLAARRGALLPSLDPDISLAAYAQRYIEALPLRGIKPKTVTRVKGDLLGHILPKLGGLKVREVSRPRVREFLLGKLSDEAANQQGKKATNQKRERKRLARGSVHHAFRVLSGVLSWAVEDQLISANPVRGLWGTLFKRKVAAAERSKIKALTPEQARALLEALQRTDPEHLPAIALMLWAGLRVGEALALVPDDIDMARRSIKIRAPKDSEARTVEMASGLADALRAIMPKTARVVSITGERRPAARASRWEGPSGPWLLYPELGPPMPPTEDEPGPKPDPKHEQRVYRVLVNAFARALKTAALPEHFTLHSLRHSYAANLIAAGVSPVYVQQQLGHSSIELTVSTYGSWFPVRAPGAVDALVTATAPAGMASRSA
jgi:integrase